MDLFSLSVYICMKMEKILYRSLKEVSIALVLKTICFWNLTLFLQKQLLATAHFSMLETTKLEVNQPHHERKEGNVNAAFE